MKKLLLYSILALCAFSAKAQTHFNLGLAWDASLDTNVVSYKISVGVTALTYTNSYTTTNTIITISNLTSGVVYHFAAQASTAFNVDSSFSPEVTYFVRPIAPTGLRTNGVFLTVQSKQSLFDFQWADMDLAWPLSTDKSNTLALYQLKISTTKD